MAAKARVVACGDARKWSCCRVLHLGTYLLHAKKRTPPSSPPQFEGLKQALGVQHKSSSSLELHLTEVRSSLDQLQASWQQEFDDVKVRRGCRVMGVAGDWVCGRG